MLNEILRLEYYTYMMPWDYKSATNINTEGSKENKGKVIILKK